MDRRHAEPDSADLEALADATEPLTNGREVPPLVPLAVGAVLAGRYRLESVLGQGGAGEVFRAYDDVLKESVALKVLRADRAADRSWIRRLAREVKVARVIRHANVCRVYELGHEEGHWFITMELATASTLRDVLRERPETPTAPAWSDDLRWSARLADARALCAGLAAIHAVGITHRDVTPQNVLRMRDGRLVISDFGLAIGPQESTTFHGGTLNYMAPEVMVGGRADQRSDVWQLGLLLHELLFCAKPVWARDGDRVTLRWPAPPGCSPVIEELAALCAACLSQDPAARPDSAVVVAGRLAAAETAKPRTWLARAWLRVARAARRPAIRWAAAAVVVAAVVAAVGVQTARVSLRTRLCRAGATRVADVWDAARREGVRHAFDSSGRSHALDTFNVVAGILDQHLRRWVTAYTEACEATHLRGEQSAEVLDLRMACLNDNLDATRALTRVLSAAEASIVDHAVEAASALDDLSRCADVRQLRNGVQPPKDPIMRKAVQGLQRQLDAANALREAGQYHRSLEILDQVVAGAEAVGYPPLIARALAVKGSDLVDVGSVEAGPVLERAAFVAEACADDLTLARASSTLAFINAVRDPPGAERWAALGAAALERAGGNRRLESWLLNDTSVMYLTQGRLEESRQALMRAIALKEMTLGPDHVDVAASLGNLAVVLGKMGRSEGLAMNARVLQLYRRWLGNDHIRVASELNNRASMLIAAGRSDEAKPILAEALRIVKAQSPVDDFELGGTFFGLGRVARAQGDTAAAIDHLERAVRIFQSRGPTSELAEMQFELARVLGDSGRDPTRAVTLAQEAAQTYGQFPAFAKQRREIEMWLAARAPRRRGAIARPD